MKLLFRNMSDGISIPVFTCTLENGTVDIRCSIWGSAGTHKEYIDWVIEKCLHRTDYKLLLREIKLEVAASALSVEETF